jgi:hypothetical protein
MTPDRLSHTPGPWRVGDAGFTVFGPPNGNPSPETIAHMVTVRKGPANARLIASAPDLLAALRETADLLEGFRAADMADDDEPAIIGPAIDRARAAIAKATQ